MDQEKFNEMLKTALKDKLSFDIKVESDIYGLSPDMQTVTIKFDGEPVGKVILNPLY